MTSFKIISGVFEHPENRAASFFIIHASFWNANLVEIVFNHAWIEFKWFKMIFYEFFSSWWWISSFVVFKSLSHLKNPCPRSLWRHNRWKHTFYFVCQDYLSDYPIGPSEGWSDWPAMDQWGWSTDYIFIDEP